MAIAKTKIALCALCIKARDGKLFNSPRHLVMLFDVRGEAICPICRARWRRQRNEAVLVER